MTKSEFHQLPVKEKVYLIFEYGQEITSRQFLYFNIKLYHVYNFFAEVWYIPSGNKIEKVEPLNLDEVLHLYKNYFDISELLK
ncbi:MAG: hypothetical protein R6U64_04365 [Bacteroidales bacterium]